MTIYEVYFEVFKEEPNIIGLYWHDNDILFNNLAKAIETNKPYNEYD